LTIVSIVFIIIINLSFGFSYLESEEFAMQFLGFSAEVNGQRPFARTKSIRGARKNSEYKEENPKLRLLRGSFQVKYAGIFSQ
jgi:hypothetical protein